MSKNSGEYKSIVGIDMLYYAAVTADSLSAYTAGTPAYLAPLAELSAEPAANSEDQYADNQVYDTLSSVGPTTLNLAVTDLPAEVYAELTGSKFDSTTGRVYENEGTPGYFALGFRALKSNGEYRYYWYPKCQFSVPKDEASTKKDTPEFKTRQLVVKALKTIYKFTVASGVTDGVKRVWGDTDTDAFSETNWFTAVQTPGIAAVDALALSTSTPADAATGVVRTSNQTLTFNNVMQTTCVNGISLIDPSDGSVVAAGITLDATKKIVTIDPTATLGATTAYLIAYNVTDIYGQTLKGSINFTTGS